MLCKHELLLILLLNKLHNKYLLFQLPSLTSWLLDIIRKQKEICYLFAITLTNNQISKISGSLKMSSSDPNKRFNV